MSAILKMLEAGNKATAGPWKSMRDDDLKHSHVYSGAGETFYSPGEFSRECDSEFSAASRNATADIQRLVSWVESADHGEGCIWWEEPAGSSHCSCGLSEIQSLLRS